LTAAACACQASTRRPMQPPTLSPQHADESTWTIVTLALIDCGTLARSPCRKPCLLALFPSPHPLERPPPTVCPPLPSPPPRTFVTKPLSRPPPPQHTHTTPTHHTPLTLCAPTPTPPHPTPLPLLPAAPRPLSWRLPARRWPPPARPSCAYSTRGPRASTQPLSTSSEAAGLDVHTLWSGTVHTAHAAGTTGRTVHTRWQLTPQCQSMSQTVS
jgi:hypothetical protein